MKVGIIAPTKMMAKYCNTYHLYCLPELVIEDKRYYTFFKERSLSGKFIFMDSVKVGWKREPISNYILDRALDMINPAGLILPSYSFNLPATLEVAKETYERYKTYSYLLVSCLEGTNYEEVGKAVEYLPQTDMRAIPSYLLKIVKEGLEQVQLGQEVVNNVVIIENQSNVYEAYGFSGLLLTSLPVRLGLQGRLNSNYQPSPETLNYKEEEDNFPSMVRENIEEAIRFYE